MITVLDVLRRAAGDAAFASRFAEDPLDAACAAGLRVRGRDARYLEARLTALARPLEGEQTALHLEEAAAELHAALGLGPAAAEREAMRALLFVRDYRFHQRLLGGAEPSELSTLVDRFRTDRPAPTNDRGTVLFTLHYGPFPLLWLWLKRAEAHGGAPPFTLVYDTSMYEPDVSAAQYARLAAAGTVPPRRRDLDLAAIGVHTALREAVVRLRSGENVLLFPDAYAVPVGERTLNCRVGRLQVAYPRAAAWLAQTADATVQGAVLRPTGNAYTITWGTPRAGTLTHSDFTEALQELLDASVGRDPASVARLVHRSRRESASLRRQFAAIEEALSPNPQACPQAFSKSVEIVAQFADVFPSGHPCVGPGRSVESFLHRARDASRSKSSPEAVRGSRKAEGGKSTGAVDESAPGSVNLWSRVERPPAGRKTSSPLS